MQSIPHLNELRASYEKKGLRILAISNESPDKLKEFVPLRGITYTVGISRTAADAYEGGGIPHAYLIAPDGTVAWEGHPASLQEGEVKKLLGRVKDFHLRKVDGAVNEAASAFKKGRLAEAEKLAKGLLESRSVEGAAEADARHVVERVGHFRAYWGRQVEQGSADGTYDQVLDALDAMQRHLDGTEEAEQAAEKEKALKADPAVKLELRASKQLGKLDAERIDAGNNGKKLDKLEKRIQKFIEKYEGTKTAKRAEMLLKAVRRTRRK